MKAILSRFFADVSGATAIEYGLIAAGISLTIIGVIDGLGTTLNSQVCLDQQFAALTVRLG